MWTGLRGSSLSSSGPAPTPGSPRQMVERSLGWLCAKSHLGSSQLGELEKSYGATCHLSQPHALGSWPTTSTGSDSPTTPCTSSCSSWHRSGSDRASATRWFASARRTEAQARGYARVTLNAVVGNEQARRLYEHLGFSKVRTTPTGLIAVWSGGMRRTPWRSGSSSALRNVPRKGEGVAPRPGHAEQESGAARQALSTLRSRAWGVWWTPLTQLLQRPVQNRQSRQRRAD